VLIHAGDLTNQGGFSELRKTVNWLEKTDFQAKIVVAGMQDPFPTSAAETSSQNGADQIEH